jgi:hypothetical protein
VTGTTVAAGNGGLARGREAARRLAWADAYAALILADRSSALGAADLELLATAAFLLGHVEDCLGALRRAQQLHADAGEPRRATRCAFWLGFHLDNRGSWAQAGGWFARAGRLLEREPADCAERGCLLLPAALQHMAAGDDAAAREAAARAAAVGRRAGDADLAGLACTSRAAPWSGWAGPAPADRRRLRHPGAPRRGRPRRRRGPARLR